MAKGSRNQTTSTASLVAGALQPASANRHTRRGRSRDWHGLKRLQLAATHAVLASVQSLSPHRPLYLSQVSPPVSPGQNPPASHGSSSTCLQGPCAAQGLSLLLLASSLSIRHSRSSRAASSTAARRWPPSAGTPFAPSSPCSTPGRCRSPGAPPAAATREPIKRHQPAVVDPAAPFYA